MGIHCWSRNRNQEYQFRGCWASHTVDGGALGQVLAVMLVVNVERNEQDPETFDGRVNTICLDDLN